MARSLVIKHEETPRTSGLFTTFLVLACAWMLACAFDGAPADAADDIDPGSSNTHQQLP